MTKSMLAATPARQPNRDHNDRHDKDPLDDNGLDPDDEEDNSHVHDNNRVDQGPATATTTIQRGPTVEETRYERTLRFPDRGVYECYARHELCHERLCRLRHGEDDPLVDLCKMIRAATRTLEVCVYLISHPMIADAVMYAHEQRGVVVRFPTDRGQGGRAESKKESKNQAPALRRAGVKVKFASGIMHKKTCILDRETVVTGSLNWSYHAVKHSEDLYVFKGRGRLLDDVQLAFDILWIESHDPPPLPFAGLRPPTPADREAALRADGLRHPAAAPALVAPSAPVVPDAAQNTPVADPLGARTFVCIAPAPARPTLATAADFAAAVADTARSTAACSARTFAAIDAVLTSAPAPAPSAPGTLAPMATAATRRFATTREMAEAAIAALRDPRRASTRMARPVTIPPAPPDWPES